MSYSTNMKEHDKGGRDYFVELALASISSFDLLFR